MEKRFLSHDLEDRWQSYKTFFRHSTFNLVECFQPSQFRVRPVHQVGHFILSRSILKILHKPKILSTNALAYFASQ